VLFALTRRRSEPGFPLLSRAFLALAVVFATIAVPFAFDRRATAALWAVEAAGVYWIGIRQRAQLVRAFAFVIEIGAGIAFAASGIAGSTDALFANAFFAGAILIALQFASARFAGRTDAPRREGHRSLRLCVGVICGSPRKCGRAAAFPRPARTVLAWLTGSVAASLVAQLRVAASPRRGHRIAACDGARRNCRFRSSTDDAYRLAG
jgi:uncharacterized membrane protein